MINFVRMVLAVAFPLSLQACAGSVRTHVTRVHNLPIDLTGRTFALMPFASQSGRLEYQDYANEMATYLIAHGLAPTAISLNPTTWPSSPTKMETNKLLVPRSRPPGRPVAELKMP